MDDVFDLVMPTSILATLSFLLLAPYYIPKAYLALVVLNFVTLLVLYTSHLLKFTRTKARIIETVREAADVEAKSLLSPAYIHVFIIPNYNEPTGLLQKTISRLASHSFAASNYVIVLAMEQTEADCIGKAEALQNEFKSCFKDMLITVHPADIPGEARGKGSNVNFACREACDILIRKGNPIKQMVVTVSDADSSIPELYIAAVEKALAETPDPYAAVFCPPIFFSRNPHKIPAAVRVTDMMWSVMVMQNLSGMRGIIFPCSTYSLSMALADKVNYWDTNFDAIGEDMHMLLKCFFKTDGVARGVPIYVPINLTNVQTEGYVSNLVARYTQAKRHYYGSADVAYTLRNATKPYNGKLSMIIDRVLLCFHVLEAHLTPSCTGLLTMLAIPCYELLGNHAVVEADALFSRVYLLVKVMGLFSLLPILFLNWSYHRLHVFLDREFLHQETRKWWHLFDILSVPISGTFFMTIPSSLAALRKLLPRGQEKYVVSEKMIDD